MLFRTLFLHFSLIADVAARLQSFTLDMGSIDGGVLVPPTPAPPSNTTSKALSSIQPVQTALILPTTLVSKLTAATNSSTIAFFNSTTSTACSPTTIAIITLPNPTPTPNIDTSRSEGEDNLSNDEQQDTANTEALSKWPHWFTAATFTLVFYDIFTLGIFIWLWAFGYLWWFRRGGAARVNERSWRRTGAVPEGSIEMGRIDIAPSEMGRGRRTSEWVRSGRGYGRVRSESWGRVRAAREVELEREMVRLGMI